MECLTCGTIIWTDRAEGQHYSDWFGKLHARLLDHRCVESRQVVYERVMRLTKEWAKTHRPSFYVGAE